MAKKEGADKAVRSIVNDILGGPDGVMEQLTPAQREHALAATRAAAEEGIVAGGGVALIRTSHVLNDIKFGDERDFGIAILKRAVEEPLRQIAANAGIDGSIVINRIRESSGNFGYNAATEVYGDMIEMGVIDPAKVVRTALQNAASVAGLLITTECAVVEKAKDEKPAGGGGGGMGGMGGMDDDF
jgi:chaperonin GroEL